MFKEIIEDELGISNLDAYGKYKEKKLDDGVTDEEINRLSPDTVPSDKFWEWINESEFSKDGITYGATKDKPNDYCNFYGHVIGIESGCLNYFNRFVVTHPRNAAPLNVLEIGPGFGAFKEYTSTYPFVKYHGIDVYPKIEGVLPTKDGDTLFPDSIADQKFSIVYSSNVFQHLSQRQRESYFSQVAQVLIPGGVFSFNITARPFIPERKSFKNNNREYVCHYGQYTLIPTPEECFEAIEKHLNILAYQVVPTANMMTFHCVTKNTKL